MTTSNIKQDFVKKQACFARLAQKEIEGLAALLSDKHFTPGETIVTEGDLVDSVYLIVNGEADVQVQRLKDGEVYSESVATLGAGAAIGLNETGFYSLSGKRTATVVAITEMDTLHLSLAEFHGFALSNSHVSEVMRLNANDYIDTDISPE